MLTQKNFPVTRKDDQACSSQQEALERWCEHYSKALNHHTAPVVTHRRMLQMTPPSQRMLPRSVKSSLLLKSSSWVELREVTACIAPEMAKLAPVPAATALHELFRKIWTSGHVLTEWKEGIIMSLYKGKGAKTDCSSYRPISMLSVPGKVFTHVLLARTNPLLKNHRRP